MITKINKELFQQSNKSGYKYTIVKGHECAFKNGIVYEHIYVLSEYLGRPLEKGEVAHHINEIKDDNRIENLELMTISSHSILHNYKRTGRKPELLVCKKCGKMLYVQPCKNRLYCSLDCARQDKAIVNIIPDKLQKELWELPLTKLSKLYGISDVALKKWVKKYNLSTPPKGYFLKKN